MPKNPYQKLFQALPPYFGGKRKLIPWIFKTLSLYLPRAEWSDLTFSDAFLGGGAISLFAKAQRFKQIQANDLSGRSQLISQALLVNQETRLSRSDILFLTQPLPEAEQPGWIEERYAGSVFSTRHARALDGLSYGASQLQCPTKQALAKLLLWHLVTGFVCMGTSIGTSNRPYAEVLDGVRDWQSLNPKRFVDESFPKLLKPSLEPLEKKQQVINGGVFRGSPVYAYQEDATAFVYQTQGDVLYLDPPYPKTLAYEKSNQVLDAVLLGQSHQQAEASAFTQGIEALEQLLDQAQRYSTWVLSYGNAVTTQEDLVSLVKRHAGKRKVAGFARAYTHMPQVSRNTQNEELLVIAY